MQKYTNNTGVSLALAVWLARDEYDHNNDKNVISVTTLLKSTKQIVLSSRVPPGTLPPDVGGLVASRMGTAIHNAIENSWVNHYEECMASLGYPKRVIDMIAINPDPKNLPEDCIPIYMEIRSDKEIEGMTISGKFDFVAEGKVKDFKSTSTFTYVNKTNEWKQKMQGSIYRWLNQDIITSDIMEIDYIFTDWKGGQAYNSKYPKSKVLTYPIHLASIPETENFIRDKVLQIKNLWDKPEGSMPACTSEELWRKAPKFKYFKNKANAAKKGSRSTKNYDTLVEANTRLSDDGYVGIVVTDAGGVTACKYCDAFSLCTQKDNYLADGSLKL